MCVCVCLCWSTCAWVCMCVGACSCVCVCVCACVWLCCVHVSMCTYDLLALHHPPKPLCCSRLKSEDQEILCWLFRLSPRPDLQGCRGSPAQSTHHSHCHAHPANMGVQTCMQYIYAYIHTYIRPRAQSHQITLCCIVLCVCVHPRTL